MTSRLRVQARRLGVVVVLLLGVVVGPAVMVTAPSAQAASWAPSPAAVTLYEYRVINAMNAQRARYGLGRLWLTACPQRYADVWADYLRRTGYFGHQSLTPILRGCSATRVAENLARGYVSADRIVALWMASPGHRANILDSRLNRIGVAAVFARGQWTVVADFTRS